MIERTNCTIEESFTKYVSEHQKTWSEYLPGVLMPQDNQFFCDQVKPFLTPFWTVIGSSN